MVGRPCRVSEHSVMNIRILGSESLGVRGLSCSVELRDRKIVIDPGVALGWTRHGFLPHPFQISVGAEIRRALIEELKKASDIIFSHFDGDHCPLDNPNPYQLALDDVKTSLAACRIWAKGPDKRTPTQQKRREDVSKSIMKELPNAEGVEEGPLAFSVPVPHGERTVSPSALMMSKIEEDGFKFVHASDIQLLDATTIDRILDWKPDIVLVSGPPLYRYFSEACQVNRLDARENAMKLTNNVRELIVDHHVLRSQEGIGWLENLKKASSNKVYCAAGFMQRQPLFLEAWRKEMYEWLPVPDHWHEDYREGNVDVADYRVRGWEVLIGRGILKPCKWYDSCTIKVWTEKGDLERYWIENYCLVGNKNCIRYRMVEKGRSYPHSMLPNGILRNQAV